MNFLKSKLTLVALATVICGLVATGMWRGGTTAQTAHAAKATSQHYHLDCSSNIVGTCTEVWDTDSVFGYGHYIGHDEPSTLFYSNKQGAGNQMQYRVTLPTDPNPNNPLLPGKSYNFQLHIAFWFGMAMCDTQSYPELLKTCTPDSDSNIVDPAISPNHPGTAFMELQFYPPGWAIKPFGNSCDSTKWCAALNIDSLLQNPVTGQVQNQTCQGIAGIEPVNFAYITKNGKPQPNSPVNPVQSTLQTFTPDPKADLFMNSGDQIVVTLHDTTSGLETDLNDTTTGQTGFMTASAKNTFGQVKFAPNGTSCTNIPYNFHPMYSTSSEKTRVPWAAHTYNISFADEIGHFDVCSSVNSSGACTGNEGPKFDQEPTDADDLGCLPASSSSLVQVSGCIGGNTGFDGNSYQMDWPDGNSRRPTAIAFSSPQTGGSYNVPYQRMGFEGNMPRVEDPTVCNRFTGVGCTLIPTTDDPATGGVGQMPAIFYPFFSTTNMNGYCQWRIGNHIPGSTNDFHQNQQYGTLLNVTYTGPNGQPITRYNDFRQILSYNPCAS